MGHRKLKKGGKERENLGMDTFWGVKLIMRKER
jgi:hypothetical protein